MVTRRSTPLVPLCLLGALAASLTSACVLVVDHGPGRDAERHLRTGGVGGRFEVWSAGEVTFTADDTAVARIARGGFLRVEERRAFRTRRVMVEPGPTGAVTVSHTVNGRDQPDDPASREELARLFLRVIRRTAIGAGQRVSRILAQSGVEGVLEELVHIEGSRANSRYLSELLRRGNLDAADLVRVADLARRHIPSSGTRASFLIAVLPSYLPEDAALDAYFEAVTNIPSSGSHARVLVSVLEQRPDRLPLARLLRSARSIPSSGTKTRVLVEAAAHYRNDPDIRDAFFEAADSVSSSGDHARTLLGLIDGANLDQASTVSLLRSVGHISSSSSRARVLMAAADTFTNDPAHRDAFLNATASISSSGDHARVLTYLMSTASLDAASLVALLRSVRGISSSGSQARVLIAAAARVRGNSELLSVYLQVARGINSSGERRRVLAAVGRTESSA